MNKLLSIIIPVGNCTKFGYQYHSQQCLNYYSNNFDKVYVVNTTNEETGLNIKFNNVEIIDRNENKFKTINNKDIFDLRIQYKALFAARKQSLKDGYLYSSVMSINSYMTHIQANNLKRYVHMLNRFKAPFGYIGRKFVLGNIVFQQDAQFPMIWRNECLGKIAHDVDTLYFYNQRYSAIKIGGIKNYSCKENYFFDLVGVETEQDYIDKLNFYENSYRKLLKRESRTLKTYKMHINKNYRYLKDIKISNQLPPKDISSAYNKNASKELLLKKIYSNNSTKHSVNHFIEKQYKSLFITLAPFISFIRKKKIIKESGGIKF